MARTQKQVNRQRLAQAIADAEANGPLVNRSVLYASVAERYNVACGVKGNEYITPSIVMLRINEWNMSIKTPVGKRGRPAGSKMPQKLDSEGNPLPRATRKSRKASPENLNAMKRGEFSGDQYQGLLARIENGSLTARIKANCLSCAGFVREEVKNCQCVGCPLWDVRPFRGSPSTLEDDTSETILNVAQTLDTSNPSSYALVVLS